MLFDFLGLSVIDSSIMKTATVADLRNHFRRVSSWIENGESVEIIKRGHTFARLVPPATTKPKPMKVDWEMQARQIWRGRVFGAAEVKAMEEFEREGEEG
jgi:antitoxin (DNA-binding transcriptional repressor) of toxin-antitoxin stability system